MAKIYAEEVSIANQLEGTIKLQNDQYLKWRNAANSADVDVLKLDASDNILLTSANDLFLQSNYVAGVSGAQLFMDGSANTAVLTANNDITLKANNDIILNGNYSGTPGDGVTVNTGKTGVYAYFDSSNRSIDLSTEHGRFYSGGDVFTPMLVRAKNPLWISSLTSDVDIKANYIDGVSGAQLFLNGASGDATIKAHDDIFCFATDLVDLRAGSYDGSTITARVRCIGSGSQVEVQAGGSGGVKLTGGATSWAALSDIRYKKNIIPLTYGLNVLEQIETIKFDYLEDSDGTNRLGFSAQNLLPIIPEAVDYSTDEDRYYVRPLDLLPIVIKATQELSTLVDQKQAQIDAQQIIIDDLLARVTALETP